MPMPATTVATSGARARARPRASDALKAGRFWGSSASRRRGTPATAAVSRRGREHNRNLFGKVFRKAFKTFLACHGVGRQKAKQP